MTFDVMYNTFDFQILFPREVEFMYVIFQSRWSQKKRSEWKHFVLSISQHSEQLWFWQRSVSNDFPLNKNNPVSIETRFNNKKKDALELQSRSWSHRCNRLISISEIEIINQFADVRFYCSLEQQVPTKNMLIKHSWAQKPKFNVGNVNKTHKKLEKL